MADRGRATKLRCRGDCAAGTAKGFAAGDGGVADRNVIGVVKFGGFLSLGKRRGWRGRGDKRRRVGFGRLTRGIAMHGPM